MSNKPFYPQGITRDLILTVSGKTASLSEQCYIYRGDRGITLNITIQQYKFKFNKKILNNVISSDTSIAYARAIVHKPWVVKKLEEDPNTPEHGHPVDENGIPTGKGTWKTEDIHGTPDDETDDIKVFEPDYKIFDGEEEGSKVGCFEIPIVDLQDDVIKIPITADWVDELDEVGTYRLQIQLYGHEAEHHRITIPPVEFYVEEPMCDYPESGFDELDKADYAAVDYVQLRQTGGQWYADFAGGQYKLLPWVRGEIITSERLNKIEYALQYTIETGLPGKSDKDHDHTTTFKGIEHIELQDTINSIQWEYDAQVSGLEKKINQKLDSIESQHSTDIHELTNITTSLRDDVDQNEKDIIVNANDISANSRLIQTNADNIKKNTDDIADNEANIAKNKNDIDKNTVDIADNKANIDLNRANITKNANDIETNKTNIAANTQNIATNKEDIEENAANIALLNNELTNAKKELNKRIDDTNTALETAKNNLNTQISELKTDLAETDAKVAEIEGNLDKTNESLTNTISRVTTLETDLETAKKDLQAEIKAVDGKLDEAVEDITENINTVKNDLAEDITEAIVTANNFTKDHTKNMVQSTSCTHVEFVTEYPSEEEKQEGYLYILIEEI